MGKSKSVSHLTLSSFSGEKKEEKTRCSNSRSILKWKIESLKDKKDHSSILLKKIFKKDFK